MHSFTLVSALAGASLVLAKPFAVPVAQPMITPAPLPKMVNRALQARESEADKVCESKADSIWSQAPNLEIGDPLNRWLESQGSSAGIFTLDAFDPAYITRMCSVNFATSIDAPASISSAYSSLMSATSSFASKLKPAITSVAKECDKGNSAGLELLLITNFDSCTSLYGKYMSVASELDSSAALTRTDATNTGSPAATEKGTTSAPTKTDAGSGGEATDAPASSSSSEGAAPRETGYVAVAAAAVMAVAGAVVAL